MPLQFLKLQGHLFAMRLQHFGDGGQIVVIKPIRYKFDHIGSMNAFDVAVAVEREEIGGRRIVSEKNHVRYPEQVDAVKNFVHSFNGK